MIAIDTAAPLKIVINPIIEKYAAQLAKVILVNKVNHFIVLFIVKP
jgi:hypothetical protein